MNDNNIDPDGQSTEEMRNQKWFSITIRCQQNQLQKVETQKGQQQQYNRHRRNERDTRPDSVKHAAISIILHFGVGLVLLLVESYLRCFLGI